MKPSRHAIALLVSAASAVIAWAEELPAQETTRVSVDAAGAEADGGSYGSAQSQDGRYVAFVSSATHLVPGDTNNAYDVFVFDRATGTPERVSVDSSGVQGNASSEALGIQMFSADASHVAFSSSATNLVLHDTSGFWDVFVRDRTTGTTLRASVDSQGFEANGKSFSPAISADGRCVAFGTNATNLIPFDLNYHFDVYVHDFVTGATERVSVDSAGDEADQDSGGASISGDGRFVAFTSSAGNLVSGDTNDSLDVFVRDRQLATTERVSLGFDGSEGNSASYGSSISTDGRFVAFMSDATNLVRSDNNGRIDVFVFDRAIGATIRVNVDSSGIEANGDSESVVISPDGRFVGFTSVADNLDPLAFKDQNHAYDGFVHDLATGITRIVSIKTIGFLVSGSSYFGGISADGLTYGFWSYSPDLVPDDKNGVSDVFVHELCSTPANWTAYGNGFPGTLGVPALTTRQFPLVGGSTTLDFANSLGSSTAAWLIVGRQRASLPTHFGGDLLAEPWLIFPIALPASGTSITATIPWEFGTCGLTIDLQVIELDAGALEGLSFSAGLELVFGQ